MNIENYDAQNKSNLTFVPQGKVSKLTGPARDPSFNVKNRTGDRFHTSKNSLKGEKKEIRPKFLDKHGNIKMSLSKKRSPKKPKTSYMRDRSSPEVAIDADGSDINIMRVDEN